MVWASGGRLIKTRFVSTADGLALLVPAAAAAALGLRDGTGAEVSAEEGRLVVTPAGPAYDLDALLSGITPENLHAEVGTGKAVGGEFA